MCTAQTVYRVHRILKFFKPTYSHIMTGVRFRSLWFVSELQPSKAYSIIQPVSFLYQFEQLDHVFFNCYGQKKTGTF